jgi:predicted adenine nucleotide alpha hydrolase (AANH) superfamily ATPase
MTTDIQKIDKNYFLEIPLEYSTNKVLMHSCCAPCAGDLMERMIASKIDLTIFFYNPNIHPKKEYEIRKNENIRLPKSSEFLLLMPIMMCKIGLLGQKV